MFFRKKDEILYILDILESYLKNEINHLPKIDFSNSKMSKNVIEKLESIFEIINYKHDEELLIFGELLLVSEKIANGDFNDRIYHLNTSNNRLNYVSRTINTLVENLKNNFNLVTKVLNEYSHSNYINRLDTNLVTKDFKLVFEGVNTLQTTITEMLIENKSNGLTLDKSSNILLENVDKLNISSNTAATSLEETAAALEEITSKIRTNTQNIAKMSKYSDNVTISVKNGENLANQTTLSMEDINIEVNSINEAITVIDQIAFQTNILSLNAAVEAATAGEAGKGYAVVPAEVRNLANRSAEAAREIKNIVGNATSKANHGKEIARAMISGYKDLNQNISQTIDLITDIEISSKEQLLGIEQINDTVNKLDHQTQQNAAIASQAHNVAIVTDKIAKLVVSNANSKEFIGKDTL